MISVLIPIYNESVVTLVKALLGQCAALGCPFEIICMDDLSQPVYRAENAALVNLTGVRYIELAENIGRSRIRNRLADLAQNTYLLFMDGDSRVVRPDYILTYLEALHPRKVIYGGRIYQDRPPAGANFLLHWNYGRQREVMTVAKRKEHPYRSFMTNNFIVPRETFGQIRFDESIHRYGYEDTLYAFALKEAGIEILHLDNPLEHAGLEDQTAFLCKTDDALDNLRELIPLHPELDTRLLQFVRQLEKWRLAVPVRWLSQAGLPLFRKILTVPNAPLWVLDLYKLGYFLRY